MTCYSSSLRPCPVSLKWSDWSVMWNRTGFPSSLPADIQESPPELQHSAKTSLTLIRPLAFRQAECYFSVRKHTQKSLASFWKVESRRRWTVPSPAPPPRLSGVGGLAAPGKRPRLCGGFQRAKTRERSLGAALETLPTPLPDGS